MATDLKSVALDIFRRPCELTLTNLSLEIDIKATGRDNGLCLTISCYFNGLAY